MKRLTLQRRALDDLVNARAYYVQHAPHMVGDFAHSLDAEFGHLRLQPDTGSLRYGMQLGVPGLRSWKVRKFPYLIFYKVTATRVVVVRVLHEVANIPVHLSNYLDLYFVFSL